MNLYFGEWKSVNFFEIINVYHEKLNFIDFIVGVIKFSKTNAKQKAKLLVKLLQVISDKNSISIGTNIKKESL